MLRVGVKGFLQHCKLFLGHDNGVCVAGFVQALPEQLPFFKFRSSVFAAISCCWSATTSFGISTLTFSFACNSRISPRIEAILALAMLSSSRGLNRSVLE